MVFQKSENRGESQFKVKNYRTEITTIKDSYSRLFFKNAI
jgi:hypothetical protein